MPEPVANILLLGLGGLALWGAYDYIAESVKIFFRALKRHRERNRDSPSFSLRLPGASFCLNSISRLECLLTNNIVIRMSVKAETFTV